LATRGVCLVGRVNLEERHWAKRTRVERLAKLMDWHVHQAMGCLDDLWHDSQDALAVNGSAEDICVWARVEASLQDRFVAALADRHAHFITEVGPGVYRIHGNEAQIQAAVSGASKRAKGGEATRRRWEAVKQASGIATSIATSPPQAEVQAGYNKGQGSAVQGSAEQNRARPQQLAASILACGKTWLETCAKMGQPRDNLLRIEEDLIARAIQENGAEAVDTALFGARHEPAYEGWEPRDHVDITRVLTKDKEGRPRIQKFLGYGTAARQKTEKKASGEDLNARARAALPCAFCGLPEASCACGQQDDEGAA
jgi:hypothetical protein